MEANSDCSSQIFLSHSIHPSSSVGAEIKIDVTVRNQVGKQHSFLPLFIPF